VLPEADAAVEQDVLHPNRQVIRSAAQQLTGRSPGGHLPQRLPFAGAKHHSFSSFCCFDCLLKDSSVTACACCQ